MRAKNSLLLNLRPHLVMVFRRPRAERYALLRYRQTQGTFVSQEEAVQRLASIVSRFSAVEIRKAREIIRFVLAAVLPDEGGPRLQVCGDDGEGLNFLTGFVEACATSGQRALQVDEEMDGSLGFARSAFVPDPDSGVTQAEAVAAWCRFQGKPAPTKPAGRARDEYTPLRAKIRSVLARVESPPNWSRSDRRLRRNGRQQPGWTGVRLADVPEPPAAAPLGRKGAGDRLTADIKSDSNAGALARAAAAEAEAK